LEQTLTGWFQAEKNNEQKYLPANPPRVGGLLHSIGEIANQLGGADEQ
jgi:hypothetical protein